MIKFGNKIRKITSVDSDHWIVSLEFSDKYKARVSLAHIFDYPKALAAEIVRGGLFAQCFVDSGALAWPNGLELCPDALRELAVSQKLHARKKAA